MTAKIKYSVVIPHYNAPDSLDVMLKSIPERTDIEVIVVDDGSKPENIAKLQKLEHTNLQIVLTGENRGGGFARNEGLRRAVGEWFISADSDDYFTEGTFDVFDKNVEDGLDALYFRINERDTAGNILDSQCFSDVCVSRYLDNPNPKTEKLLRFRSLETWNRLLAMRFIRENNIHYENCRLNIDVYYALSVGIKAKKIKVLPDRLYNLVLTDGSITRKKRSIEREFAFYLQYQKRNGIYKRLKMYNPNFYRFDFYYYPHFMKKHGIKGLYEFLKMRFQRKEEVKQARKAYLHLFDK